jgi:hypothetical protein
VLQSEVPPRRIELQEHEAEALRGILTLLWKSFIAQGAAEADLMRLLAGSCWPLVPARGISKNGGGGGGGDKAKCNLVLCHTTDPAFIATNMQSQPRCDEVQEALMHLGLLFPETEIFDPRTPGIKLFAQYSCLTVLKAIRDTNANLDHLPNLAMRDSIRHYILTLLSTEPQEIVAQAIELLRTVAIFRLHQSDKFVPWSNNLQCIQGADVQSACWRVYASHHEQSLLHETAAKDWPALTQMRITVLSRDELYEQVAKLLPEHGQEIELLISVILVCSEIDSRVVVVVVVVVVQAIMIIVANGLSSFLGPFILQYNPCRSCWNSLHQLGCTPSRSCFLIVVSFANVVNSLNMTDTRI